MPLPAHFIARSSGRFSGMGLSFPCALGKGGLKPAQDKREGDGASPIGAWPALSVMVRSDRTAPPDTQLLVAGIGPGNGWCDDPTSPDYNRLITLPSPARHERLWRDDPVYDLIVVLGYNHDPPIPGRGSAIFLHVAREGYPPTEGCIALAEPHLREVLRHLAPASLIEIRR